MIDISAAINFRYLHNNRSSMCGLFVVGQESSLTFFSCIGPCKAFMKWSGLPQVLLSLPCDAMPTMQIL